MAEPPEDRYYGAEVKHLLEESRRQAQRRESMFNEEARSGPVNDTYRAAALVKTPHLQRAEDLYQKKKPATVSGASSGHPIDTDRLPGLGNGIVSLHGSHCLLMMKNFIFLLDAVFRPVVGTACACESLSCT